MCRSGEAEKTDFRDVTGTARTITATPTAAPITTAAVAIPATLLPVVGMVAAAVERSRFP